MRLRVWARVEIGVLCIAVSVALLLASAPAAAAPKAITGKLSKPGYTVIALAANGKAAPAVAGQGMFRLRPPAKRVTLHLRAPDGVYAGPIVIRGEGRRAILGAKEGARLGKIEVRPGYARLVRALPRRWVDATRTARARRGVPIGAGVFGRVRSKPPRNPVAGDIDDDGVPDALDIDDDGDLVLDNLDGSTAGHGGRAAQVAGCGPNGIYCHVVSSSIAESLENTHNANAGSTAEQIDAALADGGRLRLSIPAEAEVNCGGAPNLNPPPPRTGGLVYCSTGGTGTVWNPPGPSFPDCCDPDGDGFGTMTPGQGYFPNGTFLAHGATTAQIRSGDLMIVCQPSCGEGGSETPAPVVYVLATVPALVSYSDTAGHSATVTYPALPSGDCGPSCNAPGVSGNGFPVSSGPDGDVVVTLTFWRPQRRAIPDSDPPGAEWIDIGHLAYGLGCPADAVSSTDPNLTPSPFPPFANATGFLTDQKDDVPSNPSNTLSYTVNLSKCPGATGGSFDVGREVPIAFQATIGTDFAQQTVYFKRQ